MTITVASRYSDVYEDYLYARVQERIDSGEAEEKTDELERTARGKPQDVC